MSTIRTRLSGAVHGLRVSWPTVVVLAAVVAFADGFLVTSLQGTIGAVERLTPPFQRWLRDSTIMLPVYLAVIVAALVLSQRWTGTGTRRLRRALVTGGLLILVTTLVAVLEVAASSLYDYYLQSRHLATSEHLRHPLYVIKDNTPVLVGDPTCDATCQALASTRSVHLRALPIAAVLLLVVNTIGIAWAIAICGGRLWIAPRSAVAPADVPLDAAAPAGAMVPALIAADA